jgi:hypothetical protein
MDPKLKAVYDRLLAREQATHEQVFREYPAFVVNWVPGRTGRAIRANTVRSWWRYERIFAFRHAGHFYFPAFQFSNGAPKPLVRRLLKLVQPENGWHAMDWFVGANAWLDDRSPVELLDSQPDEVVQAAEHANDRISD